MIIAAMMRCEDCGHQGASHNEHGCCWSDTDCYCLGFTTDRTESARRWDARRAPEPHEAFEFWWESDAVPDDPGAQTRYELCETAWTAALAHARRSAQPTAEALTECACGNATDGAVTYSEHLSHPDQILFTRKIEHRSWECVDRAAPCPHGPSNAPTAASLDVQGIAEPVYLSILKCSSHGVFAIAIEQESHSGTRLTPNKCCGSWAPVHRWKITERMLADIIEAAPILTARTTKESV